MRAWKIGRLASLGSLAAVGCFGFDSPPANDVFRRPEPPATMPPLAPASTEAAARVDGIGRQLLTANPQIGARPMFRTIGAPQPEVFHRGVTDIYITEGLVRQCTTDGQLAAILSTQLGKLVADREIAAPRSTRQPDRLPPIEARVGNDSVFGTTPDRTRLRELADYDTLREQRCNPPAPPDAAVLSRVYLLRAGFHDADLQAAAPLMQQANGNTGFEKQIAPVSR